MTVLLLVQFRQNAQMVQALTTALGATTTVTDTVAATAETTTETTPANSASVGNAHRLPTLDHPVDINLRRTVMARGQQRGYSNHYCNEPRPAYQDDSPHDKSATTVPDDLERYTFPHVLYRMCHFSDVCFAPNATLQEFAQAHNVTSALPNVFHPAVMMYFDRRPTMTSSQLLKTSVLPNRWARGPSQKWSSKKAFWEPWVLSQTEGETLFPHRIWSPIPIAIPFINLGCGNPGHALGDNLMRLYRLLKFFGFYRGPADTKFIPLSLSRERCETILGKLVDGFLYTAENNPEMADWLPPPALTNGDFLRYYNRITREAQGTRKRGDPPPLLCFQNVLSGHYGFADHGEDPDHHGNNPWVENTGWHAKSDLITDFRHDLVRHFGFSPHVDLEAQGHPSVPCSNNTVESTTTTSTLPPTTSLNGTPAAAFLIVPRAPGERGKPGWNHTLLIQELLTQHKPLMEKNPVEVLDYRGISMKEQIARFAKAKVAISMVGGSALFGLLLPVGGTMIVLERWGRFVDRHLWDYVQHIHVVRAREVNSSIPTTKNGALEVTARIQNYDYELLANHVAQGIANYDEAAADALQQGTNC